jgi:hypothetical protein
MAAFLNSGIQTSRKKAVNPNNAKTQAQQGFSRGVSVMPHPVELI